MATILSELRSLAPLRPLTINEGLSIAERQATKLLDAMGLKEPPVPELAIAALPRVQVERASPIPVSGSSQWIAGRWLIMLNAAEPMVRQRFSLGHEFKHVIDHGSTLIHFANSGGFRVHDRAEQICDYFSACLLMPRPWVKRAYCAEGIQQVSVSSSLRCLSHGHAGSPDSTWLGGPASPLPTPSISPTSTRGGVNGFRRNRPAHSSSLPTGQFTFSG